MSEPTNRANNGCPPELHSLLNRYRTHYESYQSTSYNETQLRREFLDIFFKMLGWDVDNEEGLAEQYKEVIHEDAVRTGHSTKTPDYSFRIGGIRKFFVEAKKPSIPILRDPKPALQVRSYAWSAKLPLSILTNFERFLVYDCRQRPRKEDKPLTACLLNIHFSEYVDRWSEIETLFAPSSILKGAFDRYAETSGDKRGVAEVDESFLNDIENWRELLARNIALRNHDLSERDINLAVQKTIDRIIFLRMAEDRGIEDFGTLRKIADTSDIYSRLLDYFYHADDRYNSGLFHFSSEKGRHTHIDLLTPKIGIDDKPIQQIISQLYMPERPYQFSVIPASILGQVYEQFLGKVIRLTKKHQAKVDQKHEIRKAGGVFYTPTYVTDYIVTSSLRRYLANQTPQSVGGLTKGWKVSNSKDSRPLTVVDPACGSGSFLLTAYQELLDWYRSTYTKEGAEHHTRETQPRLFRAASGEWRLTTSERKRILLTHIYGVDIDPQAVEVTKLSLLLKVLEGQSRDQLNLQLELLRERALPDLAANIKCGNSVIGPDYNSNRQTEVFDVEETYRINAFDWFTEFPAVFEKGGFDVVIGNPPYRREKDFKHLLDDIACTDFGRRYREPRMDLWYYFVHRGLDILRDGGVLSFITNAYWVSGTGARSMINRIRTEAVLEELFYLGKLPVFQGVSGQHSIFRLRRGSSEQRDTTMRRVVNSNAHDPESIIRESTGIQEYRKSSTELFRDGKIDIEPSHRAVLSVFEKCAPLGDLAKVRQGIAENPASINRKTNDKFGGKWSVGEGVFQLSPDEFAGLELPEHELQLVRPYHDLQDLGRYQIAKQPSSYLIYSTKDTCPDISKFPKLAGHLRKFRATMEQRRETKKGSNRWWHLHWPRDEAVWRSSKILSVQMGKRPAFVPALDPVYVPFSVNVVLPSPECRLSLYYLVGILNSRLLWIWFTHNAKRRGVGLEINGNVLRRAPVYVPDLDDSQERIEHDGLVSLVDRMLSLKAHLNAANDHHEIEAIEREIDVVDDRIDHHVFVLYRLSAKQISEVLAMEL